MTPSASLAVALYKENRITLEKAAELADKSIEEFIEILGGLQIAIVDYSLQDLEKELKDFE